MDQECSETMMFSTDGNIGFWINDKGNCSSDASVWGMISDIINN